MRLAARLTTAGAALVAVGMAAGCSAAPGLAYAQGTARPSAISPSGTIATATQPSATQPSATQPSATQPSATQPSATVPSATLPSPTATVVPKPTSDLPRVSPGPVIRIVGAPRKVKAKEGILVDATTGQVLWARRSNFPRPIASITKVMTALLVIGAGRLNREITVPKSVTAYVAKNDANAAGLIPGQRFTADELLHAMLIMSACDAAYTLAMAYGPGLSPFIAKMNAEAAKLGLTHTHFTSPDGLPYPTETSTYSTPTELVKLGEIAMRYPQFRSIVRMGSYIVKKGHGHSAYYWYSSNELIGHYPGVIGIKTGYTDAARHTLLFEAVRHGRTLIGVVLGSPPTSPAAGAQDAAKVLNWGFALKQAS